MDKNFNITKEIPFELSVVWNILQKPYDLNVHMAQKTKKISDLKWEEPSSEGIYCTVCATIDATSKTVTIDSVNSKYDSESDCIIIIAKDAGEGKTSVEIDYTIRTGAIFNEIVFKLFGDKIMNVSENHIFKHIEKACKQSL